MNGDPKHTPTPWYVEHTATAGMRIVHGDPDPETDFRDDVPLGRGESDPHALDRANAAFIVRAVNAHAALVEALKDLVDCTGPHEYLDGVDDTFIDRARAALKAAGVEP